MDRMPAWADVVLVPLISVLLAAAISAIAIVLIGENPWEAFKIMVEGALMRSSGWGYTLYYATNFIFTGLAVSVAFHARLFNIGGEGQAVLGSLGVTLACLFIPWPHWTLAIIGSSVAAAAFGALWILIPAYLQAKRGSHIVITTIMFNFIAAALINYLLVNHLRPMGSMEPASAVFPAATHLPSFHDMFSFLGPKMFRGSPANVSFFLAVIASIGVWLLIWHTKLGYAIRSLGFSESGAKYAGISPVKIMIIALLISGGLSGLMGVNATQGEAERLILNSAEGAGFIGIAVALMGRNHPLGVFLASILFGFLYQGGAELAMWTSIPRELIVVIQALVILFTGALDNLVRWPLESLFVALRKKES
ncbi:ABC transporter permease [Pseudooceanicola sp. CBS1P-1]|uniref:ABC transporter permease n=1 Tax=Pseudooceanicola albus TaxID=2692189 RepID=A0A6L7G4E9_9RHOB|nr:MULTISPECIES: ABC transporter permease [Pseudooceanicola]MBT9384706.1 ABC transporter permease [Pseudooceanicola endophyticus]MXN18407.1 ABC transporter permease [Pseudooceanicola albus]